MQATRQRPATIQLNVQRQKTPKNTRNIDQSSAVTRSCVVRFRPGAACEPGRLLVAWRSRAARALHELVAPQVHIGTVDAAVLHDVRVGAATLGRQTPVTSCEDIEIVGVDAPAAIDIRGTTSGSTLPVSGFTYRAAVGPLIPLLDVNEVVGEVDPTIVVEICPGVAAIGERTVKPPNNDCVVMQIDATAPVEVGRQRGVASRSALVGCSAVGCSAAAPLTTLGRAALSVHGAAVRITTVGGDEGAGTASAATTCRGRHARKRSARSLAASARG